MLTILDLAKLSGNDKAVGLVEAVANVAPEIDRFPARTIRGTKFDTVLRTARPEVRFTGANQGSNPTTSTFMQKRVECYILRSPIVVDRAIADGHEDGPAALQAIEAAGVFESAKVELGKQLIYGLANQPLGFQGLAELVDPSMTVNAGGTTANSASSVFAVKFGVQDVQLIFGNNTVLELAPFREETATDASGGKFDAYVSHLTAWVGLQCVNPLSVGRIYNLTEETGKRLTDSLIADLFAKQWKGAPDLLIMSRRSARQLQQSRSVVINVGPSARATGAIESVAPWPTEAFGAPIVVTDSISNTEPII